MRPRLQSTKKRDMMAVPTAQAPQNYYSKAPSSKAGPSQVRQLPVKPGAAGTPQGKSAQKTPASPAGAKKPFDINLYFKALGLFFNDFSKNKLPYFFKNMGPVMQNAPNWWNKLPQDEQAAYGAMGFGGFLFLVGIVLFVVL